MDHGTFCGTAQNTLRKGIIIRGKRAKALRRLAAQYVVTMMKKKLSDGHNVYNQAMNCKGWGPAPDDKGFPIQDTDGTPLMKIIDKPGTITCAWHWRVMYQQLKKRWTRKGGM